MLANEVVEAKKLDPRARRTIKVLRAAMVELLNEKEFSKISVQDITDRAEVNRATFYDHYVDKYALLNDLVREDFLARLEGKLPDAPLLTMDNLRILTLVMCDYLGKFTGHCAPSTRSDEQFIMLQQVQISAKSMILEWANRSLLDGGRSPVAAETVATVSSFAIFGAILEWTRSGRKSSPQQLTDQVVRLLTTGIGVYLVEGV
ncbi:MAG: TetR family transcriptional regulator C-terminal domain-containing protein [Anaerolineae bacterium]|nr:TetR family transcriptional regulator C-terminal domain-containing protein [Anaerolineae bacterium]